ncbi:hypothetical protein PRZ48_007220 [Zasmidium cellare]|uniref:Ubiquitin-like protease family profile domain-containing protein n=1 Tax=Zasmidium cellare TaxID=395010 RepID=A0ABR0EJP3_ZASCE|nr:hypothetical protein PRZ48_007220 [Zasmidium cellare]
MPPFLDFVNRMLGNSQPNDDGGDKPHPASHKETHDGIEEEEVQHTGSKRAGANAHGERAAKRSRPSGDTNRLIQNDRAVPKDATTISFPANTGYDHVAGWQRVSQRTIEPNKPNMAAGHRRGIRPQNSLSRDTPQSGRGGDPGRPFQKYAASQHPQLPTQASRGSNVAARPGFPNDSPQTEGRPPPKKRKMSNNSHVDLTGDNDEEQFGLAVARQGKRMQTASQASGSSLHGKSKKQQEMFASRELSSVDDILRPTRSLQEIRSANKGNVPSDHASARTSDRARSIRNETRSANGTRGSPVQLDEEDDTERRSHRPITQSQPPRSKHRTVVPAINLEEGVEDYADQYTRKLQQRRGNAEQGDRHDIHGMNGIFHGQTQSTDGDGHARTTVPADYASGRTPRQTSSRNGRIDDKTHDAFRDDEPRLNDTFRRDDGLGKKPKQTKLVDQMRGTSGSNRQSLNSEEDVLVGPRTVPSASSRAASPHKQPAKGRATTRSETQQTHEPSSIKPTAFTRNGKPLNASIARTPQDISDAEDVDGPEQVRIPIRSMCSKACLLSQKGLELVWDEDLSAFSLLRNRCQVRTPDGQTVVKIGAQEVNTWKHAKNSTCVWLCGPATNTSNGHILIEFESERGMAQCHEYLLAVIKSLKHEPVAIDTLKRVFLQMPKELHKANQRLKNNATRAVQLIDDTEQRRGSRPPAEDEEIVYEDDDRPQTRRIKARERMQEGSLAELLSRKSRDSSREPRQALDQDGEVSRHFEQPRRSTRQTQPVRPKTRTPSPVKWTRANNPPRWSHSVVYPEQGLRRVTVDFEDLERLDEGEFLNDNVVNFELRQIEENMAPEHKSKVHFFNTYFFSSMSNKNGKKDFNYEAVERWTKKTDLFNIPYIVVPINLELHWFVAIICNLPAVERKFKGFDDLEDGVDKEPSDTNGAEQPAADEFRAEADAQVEAHSSVRGGDSPADEVFEFGDDGKVTATQSSALEDTAPSSRPSTAKGKKAKKRAPALRKYDPKEPIIMSLDSFAIQRTAELKYLKLYISAEAKAKRGISLEPSSLQGMSAKGIPEQPNFCDCGVYLLGYVAEFAKDPDAFVRKVLTREDQEKDFANFDASAKRDEIREKLLKLQTVQDAERKAQKKAKAAAKAGQTPKTQKETPAAVSSKSAAPASTTQKSAAPASTAQKSAAPPKTSDARTSMPRSSPCPPAVGTRTKKLAPDDEGEELEVEPPSFVGKGRKEPSPALPRVPTPADPEDDEDEDEAEDEMLMDDVESESAKKRAFRSATPQRPRAPDIYSQRLPVPSSGRGKATVSPLGGSRGLEAWVNNVEANDVEDDGPEIIDIGDEENETARAEVPDSQERPSRAKQGTGRHIRF